MSRSISFKAGVVAVLIYTAIIGAGMAVMHHGFGATYGQPAMVRTLWVFELLGAGFLLWVTRRCGGLKAHGFGAINWSQMIWLAPLYLVLAAMIAKLASALIVSDLNVVQPAFIGLIALTTFLVGFSEELGFRGILLRAAMTRFSAPKAMLVSALGFSLLHAVNVFGGLVPAALAGQLILTFVLGLLLAPVALRVGALWPLIIWHFLWDFLLIVGAYLGVAYTVEIGGNDVGLVAVHLGCTIVTGAVLWWKVLRENGRTSSVQ